MWKPILYFLLINLVYFALVITIYAVGYEYDVKNELYPEYIRVSYDVDVGAYGQRWVRFAQVALPLGVVMDLVIGLLWYLKRPAEPTNLKI